MTSSRLTSRRRTSRQQDVQHYLTQIEIPEFNRRYLLVLKQFRAKKDVGVIGDNLKEVALKVTVDHFLLIEDAANLRDCSKFQLKHLKVEPLKEPRKLLLTYSKQGWLFNSNKKLVIVFDSLDEATLFKEYIAQFSDLR